MNLSVNSLKRIILTWCSKESKVETRCHQWKKPFLWLPGLSGGTTESKVSEETGRQKSIGGKRRYLKYPDYLWPSMKEEDFETTGQLVQIFQHMCDTSIIIIHLILDKV